MGPWTVVYFLNENTCEAVPANWIKDNKCFWPPYLGETLQNAIKKCTLPGKKWSSHSIKIYKNGTFGDYIAATKKANKAVNVALECSDLASDYPQSSSGRPIRKTQRHISSSDSEEEIPLQIPKTIPSPPRLDKKCQLKPQEHGNLDDLDFAEPLINDMPIHLESFGDLLDDEDSNNKLSDDDENLGDDKISTQKFTVLSNQIIKVADYNSNDFSSNINKNSQDKIFRYGDSGNISTLEEQNLSDSQSTKSAGFKYIQPPSSVVTNSSFGTPSSRKHEVNINGMSSKSCTCCQQHPQRSEYFNQIIRKQNIIQATLMQILGEIEVLKQSRNSDTNNIVKSIFIENELPVFDENHLTAVEMYLNIQENYDDAVTEIAKIGGDSAYEFVKRSLPKLITDNFLKQYNFLGKKQKKTFSTLKISALLIGALKKNPPTIGLSEKDGERAIAKFLKGAKERSEKRV